ncbi:hypothetical protein ColLi_09068 [Colletotrichum liriopes]|uniref:Uncharacterized protein n=1 Tax=Colletotrichum liriopes TaxID=708192 RepID=A0AA37LUU8_9PEZI|nr:hypothetical protein ColLi_09068 [Colletotrichum liriopes]
MNVALDSLSPNEWCVIRSKMMSAMRYALEKHSRRDDGLDVRYDAVLCRDVTVWPDALRDVRCRRNWLGDEAARIVIQASRPSTPTPTPTPKMASSQSTPASAMSLADDHEEQDAGQGELHVGASPRPSPPASIGPHNKNAASQIQQANMPSVVPPGDEFKQVQSPAMRQLGRCMSEIDGADEALAVCVWGEMAAVSRVHRLLVRLHPDDEHVAGASPDANTHREGLNLAYAGVLAGSLLV